MSWNGHHSISQAFAAQAEQEAISGSARKARLLYRQAAEEESAALEFVDREGAARTYGITAVSAASLWQKAQEPDKAKQIADQALAGALPAFVANQLKQILETIQMEGYE